MKRLFIIFLTGCVLTLLMIRATVTQAGGTKAAQPASRIAVAVTIPPLGYFVRQIGGHLVDVTVMVPPGGDPHTYEPLPHQLAELSRAALYVKVGTPVEFEQEWMPRLLELNPKMVVCNSAKGVALIAGGPGAEPGGPQTKGIDPHIWLSPRNAVIMSRNINRCLDRLDPGHQEIYNRNTDRLVKRLEDLDRTIRRKLADMKERAFVVFHPAWAYFARDYALEQLPVETEGKEPSARDMISLIERARELHLKTVFVSPEFQKKSAQVVAEEIKGRVVTIDPLAGDYVENLDRVATAMAGNHPARGSHKGDAL